MLKYRFNNLLAGPIHFVCRFLSSIEQIIVNLPSRLDFQPIIKVVYMFFIVAYVFTSEKIIGMLP
jgi:hypothetical protein